VIVNTRGKPPHHSDVTRATHLLALDAGVHDFTSHDMRHTYASRLIAQGHPPNLVADLLGHADVSLTLRIYAHLFDAQRMSVAVSMPDFLNGCSPVDAVGLNLA
jgi:integrase